MIAYNDVRNVHLEISSFCNASCPWCPRTFWGYPYNSGYPEVNFTLENAKTVFNKDFLKQLLSIDINGNFGDIVMNPEGPDIVEYFFSINPNLKITISTNGGARDRKFWSRLARTPATIMFCIDGLEDTHHLYRQNTTYKTVIKNAKAVIDHGGNAVWKMIKFDHNLHQIDQCRDLSRKLGFKNFLIIHDGRDTAPVFDKNGKFTHVIGNYTGEKNFDVLFYKKKNDQVLLEDIVGDRTPLTTISCQAKTQKSIFISSTGDVSPCCFTGFHPKTYGHGQYHQAANAQLVPLIKNNNALQYSLKECIEWFDQIEKSWNISTFEQGRLVICNDVCGQN